MRILLTLIVMAGLWAEIVDVKGAFLTADFEPHHKMYITVPKGFEQYYPGNVVLLLKKTFYGTLTSLCIDQYHYNAEFLRKLDCSLASTAECFL
jgi:hypothetical protein